MNILTRTGTATGHRGHAYSAATAAALTTTTTTTNNNAPRQDPSTAQQHRFNTILSSRQDGVRPTDLEHSLRAYCRRLVVTGNPLSGAHLLLSKERVAVRVYYQCDITEQQFNDEKRTTVDEQKEGDHHNDHQQNQQIQQQRQKKGDDAVGEDKSNKNHPTENNIHLSSTTHDKTSVVEKNDFDNLYSFLKAFETAIVLFVLEDADHQFEQLNDMDSPLQKAERLVHHASGIYTNKNLRVLMVPNTQAAIDSLTMITNALRQEKKEAKLQFFRHNEIGFCMPQTDISHSLDDDEIVSADDETVAAKNHGGVKHKIPFSKKTKNAMARRLAENVKMFAKEANIPVNEFDRLIDHFPTLRAIASASANDFDQRFFDHPTKKAVCDFFGNNCGSSSPHVDETVTDTLASPLNEMAMGEDLLASSQLRNDQPAMSEQNHFGGDLNVDNLELLNNEQNHLTVTDDPLVANQSDLLGPEFFPQGFDGSMLDEPPTGMDYELNNDWNQDQLTGFNGNNDPTAAPPLPASYQYSAGPVGFGGQNQVQPDDLRFPPQQPPPHHAYAPAGQEYDPQVHPYQEQTPVQFHPGPTGSSSQYFQFEQPQQRASLPYPGNRASTATGANYNQSFRGGAAMFNQGYNDRSEQGLSTSRYPSQPFGRRIVRGLHSTNRPGRRFGRGGRGLSSFRRSR